MGVYVRDYLLEVRRHLHLDPTIEKQVVGELYCHLEDEIGDLVADGRTPLSAERHAVWSFGAARTIARLLYQIHSRGTWSDAALTGLPHLCIALLFATHSWRNPWLAAPVFLTIVAVTVLGWRAGKPRWLYSWIGYALLPLLLCSFELRTYSIGLVSAVVEGRAIPDPAVSILALLLDALSAVILFWTTIRVANRDWILASVMLVPLPVLGPWLYNLAATGGLFQRVSSVIFSWDGDMAMIMIALAATTAVFVRLGRRGIKAVALIVLGLTSGAFVVHTLWNRMSVAEVLGVSICLLLVDLLPILFERDRGRRSLETRHWLNEFESRGSLSV